MKPDKEPAIAIVGAGRLGRALATRLSRAGMRDVVLVARSSPSPATRAALRQLARGRGGSRFAISRDVSAAIRDSSWVLLAVPDPEIAKLARDLAALDVPGWRARVVFHHAGALGIEPLAALAVCGAATGVFHPLEAFSRGASNEPSRSKGWVRIEGDARALRAAARLARRLELQPLALKTRLSAQHRALYHAVAALVANDALALVALGAELLVSLGARREDAERALAHLAVSSLSNVAIDGSVATALTGPAVRGDVAAVTQHHRALRRHSRVVADTYALLSQELVEIAVQAKRIRPSVARELRRALGSGRPRGRTV